jgi:cob(I)alamin adenosyltransferase
MSIVTKGGDQGTTALMYNRQVSKCHPRVEAYGAVDELNAAIGLARAATQDGVLRDNLAATQQDLVRLMGELATAGEDLPRYVKDGHALVTSAMTSSLEKWIAELETAKVPAKGWAMPGANTASAALDLARTVCRRAERRACALRDSGQLHNAEIVVYLNRLSDLLWLLARQAEATQSRPA